MPTPTKPTTPLDPPPRAAEAELARFAAWAAAYAAAELLATVFLGRFFNWGRAEVLLFFAFRPWLLLAAAGLAQRFEWRRRYGFYALALSLAAFSESLFLTGLGADRPWPEAARGLAAGALLVLLFDAVLRLGRRVGGGLARSAAIGALAILLVLPGALGPYEAIVLGRPAAAAPKKRDLMLMSALPLVWGEKGPLDPSSRPAAAYKALAEEFRIRPLDVLDGKTLPGGRLLLVAQPRALAPEELVALDDWVRRGGNALILTDPQLVWPSELPLGDIRRAPAMGLLDPLLTHWGLEMHPPGEVRPVTQGISAGGHNRRLIMFAPGRFASSGGGCAVGPTPQIARCRLGRGRAILLADADMMHDAWWVGPGDRGIDRHARLSDNPLILADWLDGLAGVPRARAAPAVQWLDPAASRAQAWLLGLLPILAAAAPATNLRLRRRRWRP
jgi:hypothetical protein